MKMKKKNYYIKRIGKLKAIKSKKYNIIRFGKIKPVKNGCQN